MSNTMYIAPQWNYKLLVYPIMAFFVVFIIWASVTEIEQNVKGEGRIVPFGQTKVLQHLEGGIIEKILVKEGDKVNIGTPLIRLSQAFFDADKNTKEIQLNALLLKEARIKALVKGYKNVRFDENISSLLPLAAQNERNIFVSVRQEHQKQSKSYVDEKEQKTYELQKVTSQIKNLTMEQSIAKERVDIVTGLLQKGASSRNDYLRELAQLQSIQTQLELLKDTKPALQKEIDAIQSKHEAFKSHFKTQNLQELNDVRVEIEKLKESGRANVDRELRKLIISPVDGVVNKLYYNTVGGIIKPGDKVVEITPSGDALMVEGRIKTNDRALVWEGQKASVDITAYDYSRYGMLEGTLISISPDSFIDQQGEAYYEVKIKTKTTQFSEDEKILPGMVANLHITTGKKSVLSYLVKPLKDISTQALKEY